mmetsp:Transcript_9630/g.41430  ORF Transcript_9630/g.41430 Transcript_9630/m.41430 type:complete len:88 (+) Transcript_9630:879-1142(+)
MTNAENTSRRTGSLLNHPRAFGCVHLQDSLIMRRVMKNVHKERSPAAFHHNFQKIAGKLFSGRACARPEMSCPLWKGRLELLSMSPG